MMVLYSHSFPQMSEECSHCGADDDTCWESCLIQISEENEYYSEYEDNDEFAILINDPALSNNMPCGQIRNCLKPKLANKGRCKNAPKELPARCRPPPGNPCNRGNPCNPGNPDKFLFRTTQN